MPEYWLGVSQPGGFDLKVSLDRRSFDRIHRARGALLEVLEPGIVNVVQANAATVLELLGALDAHIEEQGIDRPPFDGFMFFMRTSVTNWLTSWGAYREHCLALYGKDTPRWKKVRAAQRREFDASSAYRLAEGLRVYATHVRLPPLELSASEYLDPAAGEATVSRRCFFRPCGASRHLG